MREGAWAAEGTEQRLPRRAEAKVRASLGAQWQRVCLQGRVRIPSLGREGPLERGTAIQSSALAWRIPQTEEAGGLVCGVPRVTHDLAAKQPQRHQRLFESRDS